MSTGPPIPSGTNLFDEKHPTGHGYNWLAKRQLGNALALAARRHASGRLVDIGCGTKPYRQLFAPYVAEHIGIDHAELPLAADFVDVVADAYSIPLADGIADTVLMSEVLEHLEDPARALREGFRLLRPGGWLIATTPFMWVVHEEPRDFYRYSPYGLRWQLAEAGYSSIEVTPIAGQWSTIALMTSYGLRRAKPRWRPITAPAARLVQHLGWRLDTRNFQPWMSWNHLALAQRPPRHA